MAIILSVDPPTLPTSVKPEVITHPAPAAGHEWEMREYARQIAAERLPEIVDELTRRGLSEVQLFNNAEPFRHNFEPYSSSARIDAKFQQADVTVAANVNRERPYTVQISMNGPEKYLVLIPGREMSFEGALQLVDDFLAGFKAGKIAR